MNSDIALLVMTWDGYAKVWPPMVHSLKKYWPDCPYPIYWVTNEMEAPIGSTLRCSGGRVWSNRMKSALMQLRDMGYTAVIMVLEDYWLTDPVNNALVEHYSHLVLDNHADKVQLMPSWPGMKPGRRVSGYPGLFTVKHSSPYRLSVQAGLWRIDQFVGMLPRDTSVWRFELLPASGLRCLCIAEEAEWPMPYVWRRMTEWRTEPVVRGKWTMDAERYAKREGLVLDTSSNPDGSEFRGFMDSGVYIHESFQDTYYTQDEIDEMIKRRDANERLSS